MQRMVSKPWQCTAPPDQRAIVCLPGVRTKDFSESRKVAALYLNRKTWIVRFDRDFVSARKQQKIRRTRQQAHLNTEPDFRDDLNAYEASWYGLDSNFEPRII